MNLTEWAASQGVSSISALRQHVAGPLPVPTYSLGRLIMVGEPLAPTVADRDRFVVYASVSSADQKPDLDLSVARVAVGATGQRLVADRVGTEAGSRLNQNRKKFLALLQDPGVSTVVVEHRSSFARIGAEYVEAALAAQDRRLLVVNPAAMDDDLVRDVTDILASLRARLFGRRAAAKPAHSAIEAASKVES
ncbi:IS607 family transposase [Micromonospora saelicesensis]|uniref:IS607 family transposase n=1 Tax=Micromonospora saelicesensis TaxID=285676 RepID=UPI003CF60E52